MDPLPTSAAIARLPAPGIGDAFDLLESLADGVLVVDVEAECARVVWASRSCVALLGGADPRDRTGDTIRCLETGAPLGRALANSPLRLRLEIPAAYGVVGVDATVRAYGVPGRHALVLSRLADDWRARAAIDLPLPTVILTRDMRIRWINDAGVRLLGVPREEALGREWVDFVPEAEARRPIFDAAFDSPGRSYTQPRIAMTLPGQQTRWFRAHFTPLCDSRGVPDALLATAEEITGQHVAERAWELAERRFDAVTRNLLDLVSIVAPDGTIMMQFGASRVSGRDPAERVGRSAYEYVHPDDLARYREWVAQIVASPSRAGVPPIEVRKLHADGAWRTLAIRGTNLLDVPGVEGLLLQMRDDGEHQATQQTLRRTQQSLRLAIDAARLGFFEFDVDTFDLTSSEEFCAMRRFDPALARSGPRRSSWDDVHPEDREHVRAQLERVLADPNLPWDVEFRIATADGDWLWILQFGRLHEIEGPVRARRLVGVVLDIDRRKRAERGLRQSESRYRTLVALTPGFLHESSYDDRGRFTIRWASEGFTRLLGWTVDEVNARGGWDALVHADDVATHRVRRDEVLRGADRRAETRLLTKSGNVVWLTAHSYPLQDPDTGRVQCLMGMLHDVTHLKITEDALRRSEERYRLVSELAPGFVYEATVDDRNRLVVQWATAGLKSRFGWSFEQLGGAEWLGKFVPEDRPQVRQRLARLLAGEETAGENRVYAADGSVRWARFLSRPQRDPETGRIASVVGAVEDITQRKLAEERLRESEFRYRTVAELTPGYVYEANLRDDGWSIYWLAGDFEGIYGCTLERFHELGFERFYSPSSLEHFRERARALRRGETVRAEVEVRTLDGEERWILTGACPLLNPATGEYDRSIGVVEDITARKLAERQLRASESRYRAVVESIPGFVFEADVFEDGSVALTWASSGIERMYECSVDEVRARGWRSFQPYDDLGERGERVAQLRNGEAARVQRRILTARGNERWVRAMVRPLGPSEPGKPTHVVGVVEDITDAHDSADALRASEQRFRLAADAFNGIIYDFDVKAGTVQRSRGVKEVVGLDPEDLPPTLEGWRSLAHPDDRPRFVSRRLEPGRPFETQVYEIQYRVRHADGHYVDIWDRALLLRDANGEPHRIVGCAVDVTNARRMERLLAEAGAAAHVGSWELDVTSGRLTWSDENYVLHETTRETFEPTLAAAVEYFAPEYRAAIRAALRLATEHGTPWDLEGELVGSRGRRFWIRTVARPEVVDGKVVRVYGACVDIDALKRTQLLLKQQSDWLRMSIEAADLTAWRWFPDVDETIVEHRSAALAVNPPGPATFTRWLERTEEAFRPALRAALHATAADGTPTNIEYRMRDAAGRMRWVVTRAVRSLDAGRVVITGTSQDVTARREAEEQLRASEAVLRSVAENAPDFITIVDPDLKLRFANRAMLGVPPSEIVGRPIADFAIGPVDELHAKLRSVLQTGAPLRYDGTLLHPSGEERAYENRFGAIRAGERIAGVIAFTTDVTERRALERELLEIANREQRRIGSDLHDGLGQELTGVALLLSGLASRVKRGAQPTAAEVDELVALVNGAIESTRSLARGLSPVELERGGLAYALRSLAMRGRELYGLDVKFRSRVWPKLTLDAAATTHLYRIAQEALTNAARHAHAKQVSIQLNARGRRVVLTVTDDGCGMAPDGGGGMGLRIMRYRARMMGGELTIEPATPTGTKVSCRLQQPAADDPAGAPDAPTEVVS